MSFHDVLPMLKKRGKKYILIFKSLRISLFFSIQYILRESNSEIIKLTLHGVISYIEPNIACIMQLSSTHGKCVVREGSLLC
mgnify:CR=1 FL=1